MDAEQTEIFIRQLADAIEDRLRPPVPFEHELWTTKEIAAYLKVSAGRVVSDFAYLPDFPRRIELPKADGGKAHPRWKAIDVVKWVEGYNPDPEPYRRRRMR